MRDNKFKLKRITVVSALCFLCYIQIQLLLSGPSQKRF